MANQSATPSLVATLIGDVVGSRDATDRERLHARLAATLAEINEAGGPTTPLRITVGDEYQGVFETVGEALHTAFVLRLRLLPEYDVRHGIGWGQVAVLQAEPRVEDGSGWWSARSAINEVHEAEQRSGSRTRRTSFQRADDGVGPDEDAVAAALLLIDDRVSSLGERSLSVLRGLVDAQSQRSLAELLGISASAVSQRVRGDGLAALAAAAQRLKEVR